MINNKANAAYYGNNGQVSSMPDPQQPGSVPPSATRLLEHVAKDTAATGQAPSPPGQ